MCKDPSVRLDIIAVLDKYHERIYFQLNFFYARDKSVYFSGVLLNLI